MMLTDLIHLDREARVAGIVQDPANYPDDNRIVLTGADRFSDYENSDPIEVIKDALNGTLVYRPNIVAMGQIAWQATCSHPALVNAIRGNLTSKGLITREEFARLFELEEVLVGEGYVNTARRGQPVSLARTWGNSMQFLHVDPNARPERGITWGFTAEYGSPVAGRILDPDVGLDGGIRIRVGEKVKEEVVARDVGFQIANIAEV